MKHSLRKIAFVVTLGTLLSKVGGMARQLIIASIFGVGAAYDAYNYAYIVPGFLLVLLGGINGPLHTSMVSVLSKRSDKEKTYLFASLNTIAGIFLLFTTFFIIILADPLIKIFGPGLNSEVHRIAVIQLQWMAPIAFLSGLIGLGFGALSASEEFWIPSISPLLSSFCLISGVIIFSKTNGGNLSPNEFALKGGIILGISTLAGALLQWLIQIPTLFKKKLIQFRLIFNLKNKGVREILKIIFPATLSTGMLQINVCTDLFFASKIFGAASGLSYATLLVQAPLGIISNALLVPLIPNIAKLTGNNDLSELIKKIKQSLTISFASMTALGVLFIVLAEPIVALIYGRGAFDTNAVNLVSGLLIAYGFGLPCYLIRDLLVRIFYTIGDASTPFRLSFLGIGLNALFDWFLVGGPTPWGDQLPFNFGAPGLVFATAAINFLTCAALILNLKLKLHQLPLSEWGLTCTKVLFSGLISGFLAWVMRWGVSWPESFIGLFIEVIITSTTSLLLFLLICSYLRINEISDQLKVFQKRFSLF